MPNNSTLRTPESFRNRLYKQNERVMKFGLDAMKRAIVRFDGMPTYPTIVIAGTNGKGQISATLSNIAQNLGLTPGLFTSPHLIDFSERIRIRGERISESLLSTIGWNTLSEFGGTDDAEANARQRESAPNPVLTYFECCLAIALRAFKEEHVDLGVFEVGLGGRLDATNALEPDLSIITSISLDHMQYLGDTVECIAREKAGIMRSGKPVIIGRTCHDVLIEEARTRGCSACYALGKDFDWKADEDGQIVLTTAEGSYPMPGCERMPVYQRDNAAEAYFAALIASKIGLFASDIRDAVQPVFRQTRWVGRMYEVPASIAQAFGVKAIILDGAHNQDGVRAFCQAVQQKNIASKALIVNSCGDKAIAQMFPQYLTVFQPHSIFVSPIQNPRAMSPAAYCELTKLPAEQAASAFSDALARAAERVGPEGTVFISGSLYLIGEVLSYLGDTTVLGSIHADA